MSYEAERTTVGFEFNYNKAGFSGNPVPYKLKPDTAFKKGQLVMMNSIGQADGGLLVPAAHNNIANARIVGVMAESIKQKDNPEEEITMGLVYDNPVNVYRVSVDEYTEQDVQQSGTNSKTKAVLNSVASDDAAKGALVFFTEGPGAGNVRTIKDQDNSGNWLEWEEPLGEDVDENTKVIVFASTTLTSGVNVGSHLVKVNSAGMKASVEADGDATNGVLNILAVDPKHLMVDVMIAPSKHFMTS